MPWAKWINKEKTEHRGGYYNSTWEKQEKDFLEKVTGGGVLKDDLELAYRREENMKEDGVRRCKTEWTAIKAMEAWHIIAL